ncbi:hypothetical protein B0H11DRAFT_1275794 [Mycena galericulata]|nr:hypothetical protein B0H11DRAFT_1275794 [Mycena galericulata]
MADELNPEQNRMQSTDKIADSSATTEQFPSSWLEAPDDAPEVIDKAFWNSVEPPDTELKRFTTDWRWNGLKFFETRGKPKRTRYGVLLNEYFDLPGCIIPVARDFWEPSCTMVVFTLAGPTVNGRKPFYLGVYGEFLDDAHLEFIGNFPSVGALWGREGEWRLDQIKPRADGIERMQKCPKEHGHR